jgi:ubiquinone/menaquinone biosynthesis C-methylase UbiE
MLGFMFQCAETGSAPREGLRRQMKLPHDDRAAIDFVLTLRRRWADVMYPALHAQYEAKTGGRKPRTRKAAAPVVHALPSYRWFAWMERGSQKMLWRAVADAVAHQRANAPRAAAGGPSTRELDPSLELPEWYTAWDIHVQPGGVWRNDASADIYELGAKLVMLGVNDDYTFHRAFVETAVPKRRYRRIVDLGCGFGKSTWPFKRSFPEAEIVGVDLAAPCLALAAEKANQQGLAIRFRQADCANTGLEAGSADLVTSTMLIHEMPRPQLEKTLREAARLLAPGGMLRFLDFTYTGDAFRDVAISEHGARNNEPFMPGSMSADMDAICRKAGLADARWVAFDERGRGRLDGLEWPQRPEWHFPWAVLEARKPA